MNEEHGILEQVYAAKESVQAADQLIGDYLPFIRAETAKFLKRPPEEGRDDELSIAMIAFHEAIGGYAKHRGSFLKYASMLIRSRLIDHYRKEKRHRGLVSLELPAAEEDGPSLMDTLPEPTDRIQSLTHRQASRQEIEEFGRQLQAFGLSFSQVAENCPKQQRTLAACQKVLAAARSHPEILEKLVRTKKLPMKELSALAGVEGKTMERHRSYLIAILLAFTNGYEIIRGHLYHLSAPQEVKP